MSVPVKLEIFEGPLDLLLHLIRKNEVDIYDIPIALITRQYLEYLEVMRELNINLAGEFLVMASTLTHIKSRMLLPSRPAPDEDEVGEDPRADLVAQLKEHMRFKQAAEHLQQRHWLGRDVFPRGEGGREVAEAVAAGEDQQVIAASLFDLIDAFRRLLATRGERLELALPPAQISLEERMSQLLDLLRRRQTLSFAEFFDQDRSRAQLVVTFLALLELVRVGLVRVYQQEDQASPGRGVLRIFFNPPGEDDAS